MSKKPLKLFYAAGPGDVVRTFAFWKDSQSDPFEVAETYSGQFFSLVRDLQAQAKVVSSNSRKDHDHTENLSVSNQPKMKISGGRLGYFLSHIAYGFFLLGQIIRFRPHAAIISEGSTFWLILVPLSWFGIKIVPSLHCVLYREGEDRRLIKRITSLGDRFFFRHVAHHALCVSLRIKNQFIRMGGKASHASVFFPSYKTKMFKDFPAPPTNKDPFRLMYAGRVESDKGIFQLLAAVELLTRNYTQSVTLDVCGSGSAFAALKRASERHNLTDRVFLHGHCDRTKMTTLMENSHTLVVPTTSKFVEGFNKAVAEGILAGRPVIATNTCPAVDVVEDAVLVIQPDSAQSIARAVKSLITVPHLYEAKRNASDRLAPLFTRPRYSWKSHLLIVLFNLNKSFTHPFFTKTQNQTSILSKA